MYSSSQQQDVSGPLQLQVSSRLHMGHILLISDSRKNNSHVSLTVNCQWGPWGKWSICRPNFPQGRQAGQWAGTMEAVRHIVRAAAHGGRQCLGQAIKFKDCTGGQQQSKKMYWADQKDLVKGCRETLGCYCVSCELLSVSIADALQFVNIPV